MFLSISESIRYKEILPTTIFHIFKYNFLSGKSTSIIKSSPFSSLTGKIGKLSKSIFVYSVFWVPYPSIFWLKYPFLYNKPTATKGNPKSLADFKWSPESIPNPPEYIGIISSIPYSAEKYAIKSFALLG